MTSQEEVPEHVRRALRLKDECRTCFRFRRVLADLMTMEHADMTAEDHQQVVAVLQRPMVAHDQRYHPIVRAYRLREFEQRRRALAEH